MKSVRNATLVRGLIDNLHQEERTTDLLVRYWGLGRPLDQIETEELLAALDEENKLLDAPIHQRALKRMRDAGIY